MKQINKYHTNSSKQSIIFGIIVSLISISICLLGIWLIYLKSQGLTKFKILGQEFESNNVGISSIFIGAIVLLYTINKVFGTLNNNSKNYSNDIKVIIENESKEKNTSNDETIIRK